MTAELAFGPIAVRSSEQKSWWKHREFLQRMPRRLHGRRAAALALIPLTNKWVECGSQVFVADRDVRWLSLLDIPRRHMRPHYPGDAQWATLRRTSTRWGMPTLGPRGIIRQWDFHLAPYALGDRGREASEDMDDATLSRYFDVLNRLNLALTSTALHTQPHWHRLRNDAAVLLDGRMAYGMVFADEVVRVLPRPWTWMPRPYLAFPLKFHDRLFQMLAPPGNATCVPCLSLELRNGFLEHVRAGMPAVANFHGHVVRVHHGPGALIFHTSERGHVVVPVEPGMQVLVRLHEQVKPGQTLARFVHDLGAENQQAWTSNERWQHVLQLFPRATVLRQVRSWFEQQLVYGLKPRLFHAPAGIAAKAAYFGEAVDDALLWDLSPAAPYIGGSCDAFILPALSRAAWDDFVGVLPGNVAYDLTPQDLRFAPRRAESQRSPRGTRQSRRRVSCNLVPQLQRDNIPMPQAS